jgi:hypothetical protein
MQLGSGAGVTNKGQQRLFSEKDRTPHVALVGLVFFSSLTGFDSGSWKGRKRRRSQGVCTGPSLLSVSSKG